MNNNTNITIMDNNITFSINKGLKIYTVGLNKLINNHVSSDISNRNLLKKIIIDSEQKKMYNFVIFHENIKITMFSYLLNERINIAIHIKLNEFINNYEKAYDMDEHDKTKLLIKLLKQNDESTDNNKKLKQRINDVEKRINNIENLTIIKREFNNNSYFGDSW